MASNSGALSNLALNPLPLKDRGGGAFSLTRVSGIGVAIAGLLTAINPTWNTIFAAHTPSWAKPVFMMVAVFAWAIVAAADILGRSRINAGQGAIQVAPLPTVLAVTDTRDVDEACQVVAIRTDPATPGETAFLVVKSGQGAEWVGQRDLVFPSP
jgi:hypothetical protein